MSTRKSRLIGMLVALAAPNLSHAVELSLVPVHATGPHTMVGSNGVHIGSGGQYLVYEIYFSNWDPEGDGEPQVMHMQTATNLGSYGAPSGESELSLPRPACTSDAQCVALFGVPGPKCVQQQCVPAFVDSNHPEFACAGLPPGSCVWAADDSGLRWGVAVSDSEFALVDDGEPVYIGSLVLEAPPDAQGGFTLTFRTQESFYQILGPSHPFNTFSIKPQESRPGRAFVGVLPVIEYPQTSRYLLYPLPFTGNFGETLQVTLTSLHHPTRPYPGSPYPPPDFSSLEGETRWVGPPSLYRMSDSDPNHFFWAARLQCEPHTINWSGISALYIFGPEILPDSVYAVGWDAEFRTGRWADLVPPFEADRPGTQPDIADITAMVDRFRNIYAAPHKAQVQVQPEVVDPSRKVGFADIALAVSAYRGYAYPFAAPPPCP